MVEEFWISEERFVHDFYDNVDGLNYEKEIRVELKKKINDISDERIEEILKENDVIFHEAFLDFKNEIWEFVVEEQEVDEGRGTWGYFLISIDDSEKTLKKLKKALRKIAIDAINFLEIPEIEEKKLAKRKKIK